VRGHLADFVAKVSAQIDADDAELRAALVVAILRGVIIDRYLLRSTPTRDASPDHILRLLRPCLRALTRPGRKKGKRSRRDGCATARRRRLQAR